MPDGDRATQAIREKFPDAVKGSGEYRSQHWVELEMEHLPRVCEWLRSHPELSFDYLVDVTAVHWPDDPEPVEMVYQLYSYARREPFRLKARVADGAPVPTVSHIWKSANWNERETFDMFGIRFEGHPDLRRILMPDDYTDFPLRKENQLFRG